MSRAELATIAEESAHDRAGGDRQDGAEESRFERSPAKQQSDSQTNGHDGGDLQAAAQHGDSARAPELPERYVHADGEHQEHQADVRQRFYGDDVAVEAGCMRTDDDPGGDEADDGGLAQESGDQCSDQAGTQRDGEVDQQA